jgi:2-oxoglutarate dehydrogenase E2 component (dihydrolipoamide succinyltransferase)
MIVEIKIPSAGESITEVAIGSWLAEDKSYVEKDQEIAEVESDKATLPLIAPESGMLSILIPAGKKAQVGDIACLVDTSAGSPVQVGKISSRKSVTAPIKEVTAISTVNIPPSDGKPDNKTGNYPQAKITPLARTLMKEHNLDVDDIILGLKKISRQDVEQVVNQYSALQPDKSASVADRSVETTPMSPLRRKLSKRLVAVKNETAMLTTFNEVDMSAVLALRKKFQQAFLEKHGVKLGLMSFFIKASAVALKHFPRVNSMIDGDDMITPGYVDIAVAVQTEKGLMVPVIRNAHVLNLTQIEMSLAELAQKARTAKLTINEMTGGTFTITNGGVFGSMLSTPILNPPQSAILGMHNTVDRPVAILGKIEIRPIMYLALSYDHRVIDGRDSVSFLMKVKELIESPMNMILGGTDPEKLLLNL